MQSPQFETFTFPNGTIEACYVDTSLGVPCGQGSVSAIGVDARSPSDIAAALAFASEHNLRLVVKNTGHDFLDRSAARGSFMVWTHNLKDITVHPTFTPSGAPECESEEYALTIGSGVQWFEAYAAANATGRILVGGVSARGSVGAAGGWLAGGGHSALSPSYGLGIDNALQFTVVTASGEHLTANSHQNSDLFWALRGGGGGTFGVVTSATYRTRPSVPIAGVFLTTSVNGTKPNAAMSQAVTELVRITPRLEEAGWGGYFTFEPSESGTLVANLFFINPNITLENANATVNPYLEYVQALAANSTQTGNTTDVLNVDKVALVQFPTWYDWYHSIFGNLPGDTGVNNEVGSWLVPLDALETRPEEVANTLLGATVGFHYYVIAGGAVSKVDPRTTGLNPAWRKAGVHIITGVVWPEGTTAETIEKLREVYLGDTAKFRALAPESGAYLNEASMFEPDPAHSFFGAHYDTLSEIKAKYDPDDLFVVAQGVGSREWDKDLLCRV